MPPSRTLKTAVLLSVLALLSVPALSRAFELVEFLVDLTVSDPVIEFDYQDLGAPKTGVRIANPLEETLDVRSTLLPNLGLIEGEGLQAGFVLYDGTLVLEVAANETGLPRMGLQTTYRMQLDPRMLRENFLRSRFVRQGRMDSDRALLRAQAARFADARMMRFVEDESGGRWLRASRAVIDSPRADIRFVGRMRPDGVLGHYGYYTETDGSAYVWAVLDKNSRYAVGLNVDDDDDGIFNSEDNCRHVSNADQMDFDGDEEGDACDADDDADGVLDVVDNCPLTPNPRQEDLDFDGIGDICDSDADGDGIGDDVDECPGTEAHAVVDGFGCSVTDRCPCDSLWKNHGAYVRCTARSVAELSVAGLLTTAEGDAVLAAAAQSLCGK